MSFADFVSGNGFDAELVEEIRAELARDREISFVRGSGRPVRVRLAEAA